MSNIQFEEGYNQINSQYYNGANHDRGITSWLIKKGIVKNKPTAQILLLVIAVICFGLAFYLMNKDSWSQTNRFRGTSGNTDAPTLLRDRLLQNQ